MASQKEEWRIILGIETAEISESSGIPILILLEASKGSFKNVIIYISTNSVWKDLLNPLYYYLFSVSAFKVVKMVIHVLILISLIISKDEPFSIYFLANFPIHML